jgi:hypothetical protein
MILGVGRRASGPKALVAPYATASTSAGNLKLNVPSKRIVLRLVARKTGTLSKLWIKVRALSGPATTPSNSTPPHDIESSSYVGGTVANWSWLVKWHPVNQATGVFDPATVLATETFNPNTRMLSDSAGEFQAIGLVAGISVTKGLMYAVTIEPANGNPATDYASWNFLYNSDGGVGSSARNELNKNTADAYMSFDPRETIGGALSDGTGQSYPANNFNYPGPFSKHVPTYIQVYSDGTATGQPYYTGNQLSSGVAQTMNFRALRPQRITHIGGFFDLADTFTATFKVNGAGAQTVTLSRPTLAASQIVRVKLPTPVDVVATDTITIDFTPGVTGSIMAYYSDAVFLGIMGNQTSSGPFYLTSNNARVAGVFPLPWMPEYDAGFGASAAYLGVRGVRQSSTSGATQVITLDTAISAGSRVVVIAGGRNAVVTLASATDSRGNTYTVDAQKQDVSSNNTNAICSAPVTTPLQINDTITLTWSGAGGIGPSNLASAHEFTGLASASVVDRTTTGTSSSSTATPTLGPSSNTTQAQEMVVVSLTPAAVSTVWTPGNGYTALGGGTGNILKTSGATSGDRCVVGACLPVSFAGPQTFKGAWTPSTAPVTMVMVTYKGS